MMWSLVTAAAVVYILFVAFRANVLYGIGAVAAVLAYGYFKWYSEFCVTKARQVYTKDPKAALVWFARAEKRGMSIGQKQIYAYYLLREGQVEKAEKIYQFLLSQNLNRDLRLKVRANYAVLLMKTNRLQEAIAELEDVTVHMVNTTTYGSLGYLYLLAKNKDKATAYNLEAYDYNSDDPVILDNLVQLYIMENNYAKAKEYADILIAQKPYFVEAYYDAAYATMKLGDMQAALDLLEQGEACRITFMSNVTKEDMAGLKSHIEHNETDIPHRLGVFSDVPAQNPIAEELPQNEEDIPYAVEYEPLPEDEDDPFI